MSFTALGAWAWFLSHGTLTNLGQLLLVFVFLTNLFQIGWSGHLKEMGVAERSNLLIKLGAAIHGTEGNRWFEPGRSLVWGWGIKLSNVIVAMAAEVLERKGSADKAAELSQQLAWEERSWNQEKYRAS